MTEKRHVTGLGSSIGFNIINVSWQIKETLRKEFLASGFDVTSDQFAVLLRLWDSDGISQLELCQRTCKNKSNLTRILDSMEKRDLIFRQLSKQDRRSYNILLTENGKSIKEPLITKAQEVHNAIFKGVSEQETGLLWDVFARIGENIENIGLEISHSK